MPSPAKVLKVEDVCNPAVCQPSLLQDILGDINIFKCEPAKSPIEKAEDQVTYYKQDPPVNLTIYPLFWWRIHQDTYQLLARLAKCLLCIPATSVPSERVLSTAGDIVNQQR